MLLNGGNGVVINGLSCFQGMGFPRGYNKILYLWKMTMKYGGYAG